VIAVFTDSAVFTASAGFPALAGAGAVTARRKKTSAPPNLRRGLIVAYLAIPFKVEWD
jgi:hypothetical protein